MLIPPSPVVNNPTRDEIREQTAEHISEIIHRLSFTGLLGASLMASSLQPDTSTWAAAAGTVLVLPTVSAVRNWIKEHNANPIPLREVLPLVPQQTPAHYFNAGPVAKTMWWAAVGVAACVSTMLAARIATPDYDYQKLESSTSATRLQDARPNKSASFVLDAANNTVKRLKESNQSPEVKAKIHAVEQAKVAYMLYAAQSMDPKVRLGVWSEEAQTAIRTDPTLRQNLPETLKAQYVEHAKKYIASFSNVTPIYTYSTPHTVGYTEQGHFKHAFHQLCAYANNPNTQQFLNSSWQNLAHMQYKSGKSSPVNFVEAIKKEGYTSCDNVSMSM